MDSTSNIPFNNSMEIQNNTETRQLTLNKIAITALTTVSLFIITMNTYVAVFLCRVQDKELQDRALMVLCLCYCDITLGVGGLLMSTLNILHFNYPNKIACAIFNVFIEVGVLSSVYQTLFICLERFLTVTRNTVQQKIFGRRKRYIITFSLLILFTIASACCKTLMVEDLNVCSLDTLYGEYYDFIMKVFVFALYIPPVSVTIVLYLYTVHSIKVRRNTIGPVKAVQGNDRSSRKTDPHDKMNMLHYKNDGPFNADSNRNKNELKHDRGKNPIMHMSALGPKKCLKNPKLKISAITDVQKTSLRRKNCTSGRTTMRAVRTLGIVITAMILTTGTGSGLYAVVSICSECEITKPIRAVISSFWFLHSALNPIIYTFSIEEFRRSLVNFMKCKLTGATIV